MGAKTILPKMLFIGAGLCGVAYVIALAIDWHTYLTHPEYSASFGAYVLVRSVEFLSPGVTMLVMGIVVRSKTSRA